MLVLMRGAGDIASGVAVRLHRAGARIVMTDLPQPTAIRRTVSFCRALWEEEAEIEGIRARRVADAASALEVLTMGDIAVLADPQLHCLSALRPDVLVDAVLAKKNLGTRMGNAPIVVALGPGFTAGEDCHAVVETMRGHDLGRVLFHGSALANTGVPGLLGGYAEERILRAPVDGVWRTALDIGALVQVGDVVATVADIPVYTRLSGVVRGLLRDGTPVKAGMKSGDVDPRGQADYCRTVSDKARAVGGGVLEAILALRGDWTHGG